MVENELKYYGRIINSFLTNMDCKYMNENVNTAVSLFGSLPPNNNHFTTSCNEPFDYF